MHMKKFLIPLLVVWSFAASHDLWIEKEGNRYVLYYGHLHPKNGDEKLIKYKPEEVLKFECLDVSGKAITSKFERSYPAKLEGSCGVVFALFSSGYWTRSVHGLKNLPKDQVQDAIESWLSYESVKRINLWSEAYTKPLEEDIDIVPLENPLKAKVNEKITLSVYYKGKPLENAVVAYDEHPIGATDEHGRINIRIKHSGLQMISTSIREKADGIKADYVIKTVNLSFEVK
jgi:nickel transport protein